MTNYNLEEFKACNQTESFLRQYFPGGSTFWIDPSAQGELNFSCFPNLERLAILKGNEKTTAYNLADCSRLTHFQFQNLGELDFSQVPNLTSLVISRSYYLTTIKEIEQLKAQLAEHEQQETTSDPNESLNSKIQRKKAQLANVRDNTRQPTKHLRKEIELLEKIQTLETQVSTLQTKETNYQEQILQKEQAINAKQKKTTLQEQITQLAEQKDTFQKSADYLRSTLKDTEQTLTDTKNTLAQTQENVQKSKEAHQQTQNQKDEELTKKQEAYAKLEAASVQGDAFQTLQKELAQAQSQVATLEEQLNAKINPALCLRKNAIVPSVGIKTTPLPIVYYFSQTEKLTQKPSSQAFIAPKTIILPSSLPIKPFSLPATKPPVINCPPARIKPLSPVLPSEIMAKKSQFPTTMLTNLPEKEPVYHCPRAEFIETNPDEQYRQTLLGLCEDWLESFNNPQQKSKITQVISLLQAENKDQPKPTEAPVDYAQQNRVSKKFHLRTDIANVYNAFYQAKNKQTWDLAEFLQELE
ncbi:9120_t:CDS:10 [Entrophospora sp. SA101]|nr:5969_t:CDS:10 [Entrophospora sp. SA101]CAJ0842482.1 9120_t:CDS:10 [Entrophospora sp. SA101]